MNWEKIAFDAFFCFDRIGNFYKDPLAEHEHTLKRKTLYPKLLFPYIHQL